MYEITVGVKGMACEMCEAHINETIRKNFNVEKVTSSHKKNETVILSKVPLSEAQVKAAIDPTGYEVTSFACADYDRIGGGARPRRPSTPPPVPIW